MTGQTRNFRARCTSWAFIGFLLFATAETGWAQSINLTLTSSKHGPIKGEPGQTSLGRQDTIECLAYESELIIPINEAAKAPRGQSSYKPIKIRKRFDRASPLLDTVAKQNAVLQGTFRFYRSNPNGDGTVELFQTVEIRNAYIASLRQVASLSSSEPLMEEVEFVFQDLVISPSGAPGSAPATNTAPATNPAPATNTAPAAATETTTGKASRGMLRLPSSLVVGEESPITLRFESLASVPAAEVDGRTFAATATEEILNLSFVAENTGKSQMQIAWDAAPMTLVSSDGTRINFNQSFASPTTKQSVVQALPAGERMKLYTLFLVPKGFVPVKLVVNRENKNYEAPVTR